jgi:hypothetical protein
MRALIPRSADMHAAAGEADAKLEETIYKSLVLPSTVPCQCVITQPKIITDHFACTDSMPHHARARPMPVLARTCTPPLEKWMRSWKRRFTCLQFCSPPLRANGPMRNYSANFFHRSFCLCRFHATPRARSSHASARADMHAAAVQPPLCSRCHI